MAKAKARAKVKATKPDLSKIVFTKLDHAICKAFLRHAWEIDSIEVTQEKTLVFNIWCPRCKCEKTDEFFSSGIRAANPKRSYDADYLFKGVGMRPTMDEMRGVMFHQFLGTDNKLHKQPIRKPSKNGKVVHLKPKKKVAAARIVKKAKVS